MGRLPCCCVALGCSELLKVAHGAPEVHQAVHQESLGVRALLALPLKRAGPLIGNLWALAPTCGTLPKASRFPCDHVKPVLTNDRRFRSASLLLIGARRLRLSRRALWKFAKHMCNAFGTDLGHAHRLRTEEALGDRHQLFANEHA